MTWRPPEGDRRPDPATPAEPIPEPDAETARVPLEDPVTPTQEESAAPTPTPTPSGLISAAPVGWVGPDQDASTGTSADDPAVAWAAPVTAAAPASVTEGLVIAGVFSRLVAYCADILLLGSANLAVSGAVGLYAANRNLTTALFVSIFFLAIDGLYFVGLWSSGWQATLGMRLLRLRVLGARDAATLSVSSALIRWLALSGGITILTLIPGIGGFVGLIAIVWVLALLITTGTDRLHQGLHDKWAGSVVVQPAPGGSGAAIVGCLVLVVLVGVFLLVLFALALSTDEVRDILSRVGSSI